MIRLRRIFVAMPNDGTCEAGWDGAVRPALQDLGFEPVRLRTSAAAEGILPLICGEIDRSDALIALVFARNAHVYFEIGYALAQDKKCLIITDDPQIASFFDRPANVLLISDISALITLTIHEALAQMLAEVVHA